MSCPKGLNAEYSDSVGKQSIICVHVTDKFDSSEWTKTRKTSGVI